MIEGWFKADFDRYGQFRPPADTHRFNQYDPILAESAPFSTNQGESKSSQRELVKKKKSDTAPTRRQQHCSRVTTLDAGAATILLRWKPSLFLQKKENLASFYVKLLQINYNNQRVDVELVTYLDSCKGVSCVLRFAHQIS